MQRESGRLIYATLFGLLIYIFSLGGLATAQEIAPTQIVTAYARSFDMPLGAMAASSGDPIVYQDLPAPKVPIGNAKLRQLRYAASTTTPTEITLAAPAAGAAQKETVTTNCVTNDTTNYTPSDIHGAVGPTNLVVTTNVDIGVYTKSTCAQISRVGLTTLMGAAVGEILFDPQVLWDNTNGRFIIAAESEFSGNSNQNQWFAVSKDSTGTSWWVYQVLIRQGATNFCVAGSAPFWDYPHVGSVNGSNPQWTISANVFPSGEVTEGAAPLGAVTPVPVNPYAALLTIDKTPTLSGQTTTIRCFDYTTGLQYNLAAPNVLDSNNTAYLLSPGSGSGSSIQRYALNTSNNTITTTSAVSIPAWTAAPNAPQPNSQTLDALDGRFVSQTIQNGTNLWNVHAVAYGGVGLIRAYQLDTAATSPVNTVTLSTTSIGAPTDYLFNTSIATNGTKAFISASRTAPSAPSAGNAAMVILSGPNTLTGSWSVDVVATSAAEYSDSGFGSTCNNWYPRYTCRWGDYSSIQIDPSDSSQAWGFNQLITGTTQFKWTTRAAACCGSGTFPQLQVSPATDISASGPLGGPFSPGVFTYSLSASASSLNFAISGIPSWLNASFTSGSATTLPMTITFMVQNVSSLTVGTYNAVISFTNTTNGLGNTTRNATLYVTESSQQVPCPTIGKPSDPCALTPPLTVVGPERPDKMVTDFR